MAKDIKIPYNIIKRLTTLLNDSDDDEIIDLYIYLQGKCIQSDLRDNYDKNDKNQIELYHKNKKMLDDISLKLQNVNNYKNK